MITRGKKGITLFSSDTIRYAPALAVDVVDAVGAGDAVFSIAATAAYVTKNEALIVFLSSIMGMLATGIVGNSKSIEKHQIMKSSKGFI